MDLLTDREVVWVESLGEFTWLITWITDWGLVHIRNDCWTVKRGPRPLQSTVWVSSLYHCIILVSTGSWVLVVTRSFSNEVQHWALRVLLDLLLLCVLLEPSLHQALLSLRVLLNLLVIKVYYNPRNGNHISQPKTANSGAGCNWSTIKPATTVAFPNIGGIRFLTVVGSHRWVNSHSMRRYHQCFYYYYEV